MTKNILLAASALSVLAFAGAASAHDLTFRDNGGGVVGDIDATDTGGATAPYELAEEARVVAGDSANFLLVDTLSGGSSLPSGNVLLTVALTGGTFDAGVTGGNISAGAGCPTFTATISSGGAAGSAAVTYIISNSSAGCSSFNLDLPILPSGANDVSVSSTLRTEAGTPIDGLTDTLQVIDRVNAFNVVFDAVIGSTAPGGGALGDTFATLTQLPVYTEFATVAGGIPGSHAGGVETATAGQLGTITIVADATAYSDLQLNNVDPTDLTEADVAVTGSWSAFDGVGGDVELDGVSADDITGNVATFEDREGDLVNNIAPFIVTRETADVAIPASSYSAQVSYTLEPTIYNQEGPFTGALERIGRDGTNVVFPWLNDTTVSSSSGTTNRIRLGNTGSAATGPVYAEVLNQTGTVATAPVEISPGIPAGGELRISTATLTSALGAFGRGDVRISVEAPADTITARRYLQTANGGITELSNGTVASEQTPNLNEDVE